MPDSSPDTSSSGLDRPALAADELVGRVTSLLQAVATGGAPPEHVRAAGAPPAATADLEILASQIAAPGLVRERGVRGFLVWHGKRSVHRVTRWYVESHWQAQREWNARVIAELDRLARQNLSTRLQVLSFLDRVDALRHAIEADLAESRQFLATKTDVECLARDVDALRVRLGVGTPTGVSIDYLAFEDRFRGASNQIAEAQLQYLDRLPSPSSPGRVLDVGCGRGEFLQALTDAGHDAVGADLSREMVKACTEKGLDVVEDDGIRILERSAPGSFKAVVALQLVEHLFTAEMERLVAVAHDALAPGGVLLMETINPRSLHALGNHFFADLSHVRPVHPETLRFVCEQVGFQPVDMVELSPHPLVEKVDDLPDDPHTPVERALVDSVFGYQDYAVIATKPA